MANPSPRDGDLKFYTTDESLVGYYLRNRVNTGKDGFVTDIELYKDEPWLLPHVKNNLFKEKRWFYFVVRTRRSGNRPNRTVPGREGSNGGTWTTTGVKKEIIDSDTKAVIGYRTELAYHKSVKGKLKGDTTGWVMTEYWLASKNDAQFQEVVLCHLRDKNKKVNKIVVDQLPENKNGDKNIVVKQPEQENSEDNNNMISNALVSGVEGGELDSEFGLQINDMFVSNDMDIDELLDFTHQEQLMISPPQDMMVPSLQGQDSCFHVQELTPTCGAEGLGLQNMMEYSDKSTQEQQHPQIYLPPQRQDYGSRHNPLVIMEDECIDQDEIFNLVDQEAGINDKLLDFTHQQQPPPQDMMVPPLQGQDSCFHVQDMTPTCGAEGLDYKS